MKVAVLDLEFTQPTQKVIQIGAVSFDMRGGDKFNTYDFFVNPNEEVSSYITELTGIDQAMVNGGLEYDHALVSFWTWIQDNQVSLLASWGTDHYTLYQDSIARGIKVPKLRYLDIKSMFQIIKCGFPSAKVRGGLGQTLKMLNIPFEGNPHNAYWDAYNTAKLLKYARNTQRSYLNIQKLVHK